MIVAASHGGGGSPTGTVAADSMPTQTKPKSTPKPPKTAKIALSGTGAYDPEGDRSENDADAPLAVDRNLATAWKSERYRSAFTKSGVGLVLDAGRPVKASRVVLLTDTPGYKAEIQVGDSATGPFTAVSDARQATGRTVFTLRPRSARYVMIWITSMPPGGVAAVSEVIATAGG